MLPTQPLRLCHRKSRAEHFHRALRAKGREVHIAKKCLECASAGITDKEKHVGYYLIDKGQKQLNKSLEITPSYFFKLGQEISMEPFKTYLLIIFLAAFLGTIIFYEVTRPFFFVNLYYWIGLFFAFIVPPIPCFIN